LVPADQRADSRVSRRIAGKAEIARGEIKFFKVERIVGNMHLPINPRDCAVGIDHRRSVVINTRRSSLEQRGDDDDFMLRRERAQSLGGRTGDRFSQFEILVILALAKIARAKKFLEANDLRALFCRRCDSLDGLVEIRGCVLAGAHLNEPQGDLLSIGLACHKSHSLETKKGRGKAFPLPLP